MKSNKHNIVPDVVRGGVAIPIKGKTNYYYMRGRKHKNGGIDIGKNPRTGLEVEDGEIMHLTKNETKVFSAQPFLNGESPANKVLKGENPNKVFNEQERYKAKYGITNEGNKAENGILDDLINNAKDYYNITKHNINTGINYIKRKVFDDEKPKATIISLKDKNVSRITPNVKDTESILFNDFVENNPNNIRKAKDFKNTKDKYIGDKGIPLNKISYYYGIENGKLRVGDLNIFDNETTVIPVRNKKIGKVKKIINNSVPKDSIEYYTNKLENLNKNRKEEENKIYYEYGKKHNIEPSISDYFATIYGVNPFVFAGRKAYRKKYKHLADTKYDKEISHIYNRLHNPISLITEHNDTIDLYSAQMSSGSGGGKAVFGDEKGNAYFVNDLKNINKTDLEKLNKQIEKNPVYPVMVDNGRYAHFYEKVSPLLNYNTYVAQDFYRNPKNIFVVGTKNRTKMKNGGKVIRLQANGKDRLINVPSTGNLSLTNNSRTKAQYGVKTYKGFYSDPDSVPNFSITTTTPFTGFDWNKNEEIDAWNERNKNVPETIRRPYEDRNYTPTKTRTNIFNKIGNYIKENGLIGDAINLGGNILGSVAGSIINRNAIKDMSFPELKYTLAPAEMQAAKLKTRININPQLDRMREDVAKYERAIDANTSSSRTALSRKNQVRLANMLQTNQLYGDKENAETDLINKDRLNRQSIANENIARYNQWMKDKTEFENNQALAKAEYDNKIAELKSENKIGLINNLVGAVGSTIDNIAKRKSENKTILANVLSHPNLPVEVLYNEGIINKKTYDSYRKAYPLKK